MAFAPVTTGTLDPFATGLLLVALGSATRLIAFLPSDPKVYRATLVFGSATDTDRRDGNVVAHCAAAGRNHGARCDSRA